jgi:hypothetical protein
MDQRDWKSQEESRRTVEGSWPRKTTVKTRIWVPWANANELGTVDISADVPEIDE